MTLREFKLVNDLYRAALRLMPAEGYVTDDLPDNEIVNLTTTVSALRQLQRAVAQAAREIEPQLAPAGEAAVVMPDSRSTMG